MTKLFKPMLACSQSVHHYHGDLRFPMLASAKIDGIRATVRNGVVYARSNEPIRNSRVQLRFGHLEHFDGELALGNPTAHDLCRRTGGVTNSIDKPIDDLSFYVFDHVKDLHADYQTRFGKLADDVLKHKTGDVRLHKQVLVRSWKEALDFEDECLDLGYEGVILRNPAMPYKLGRSTAKEQSLLKLKRFEDAEAEVIGFVERQHNGNEATTSALGRTKRSSHKANKTGRGDLGALVLRTSHGVEFQCGAGFDDAERKRVWDNQHFFLGKLAKYKFFAVGMKEAPRHPVFLSWRDRSDLS